jgi:hypothetical protein
MMKNYGKSMPKGDGKKVDGAAMKKMMAAKVAAKKKSAAKPKGK